MMGLQQTESVPELAYDRGDGEVEPVTTITNPSRHVERRVTTGGAPTVQGRTLIVGDSFFDNLMDHIAPWFADVTFVPVQSIACHDTIKHIGKKVDLVILERVERNAYRTDYEKALKPLKPLIAHLGGRALPREPKSCTEG